MHTSQYWDGCSASDSVWDREAIRVAIKHPEKRRKFLEEATLKNDKISDVEADPGTQWASINDTLCEVAKSSSTEKHRIPMPGCVNDAKETRLMSLKNKQKCQESLAHQYNKSDEPSMNKYLVEWGSCYIGSEARVGGAAVAAKPEWMTLATANIRTSVSMSYVLRFWHVDAKLKRATRIVCAANKTVRAFVNAEHVKQIEEASRAINWKEVWRIARKISRKSIGPKQRQFNTPTLYRPPLKESADHLAKPAAKGGCYGILVNFTDTLARWEYTAPTEEQRTNAIDDMKATMEKLACCSVLGCS